MDQKSKFSTEKSFHGPGPPQNNSIEQNNFGPIEGQRIKMLFHK